jgi:tetratricopeptide (TPR) repeat protein
LSSRVVGIARSYAHLLRRHGFAAVACTQRFGETLRSRYGTRDAYRDPRSQAIALNALGSELRRKGEFAQAAEQHRMALALFRAVGDQRAEALTLNNLALAIDRSGDYRAAIEMFEQATAMLRDLGDEEYEGQVMANLALAFRRHGSEQRCAGALEAALAKLNPQTNAYRKVDQLRRAS